MQYAVIKSGGKQYKVSTGETITLDRLNFEDKKTYVFNEVLLLVKDGKVSLGKPTIKGATVSAKLIEQKKGDKISVNKYKAKARYRRAMGFRPQLCVIQIEKIGSETTKTAPRHPKK